MSCHWWATRYGLYGVDMYYAAAQDKFFKEVKLPYVSIQRRNVNIFQLGFRV